MIHPARDQISSADATVPFSVPLFEGLLVSVLDNSGSPTIHEVFGSGRFQ